MNKFSIENNDNSITYIHNSSKMEDKKMLPYAKGLNKKVVEYDIDNQPLTTTMIAELLDASGNENMHEIVDPRREPFNKKPMEDYPREDLIQLLAEKNELINTPIAIAGGKVFVITETSDLLKLDKSLTTDDKKYS